MQVNPAQAHISTPHTTEFSRIICMKLSVFFGWCSIFTRGGDSLRTAAAIVEALFSPEGGNYHKQILKNVNGASSGMMWYWQVFLIGQSILSYKRQQSLVLVFSHSVKDEEKNLLKLRCLHGLCIGKQYFCKVQLNIPYLSSYDRQSKDFLTERQSQQNKEKKRKHTHNRDTLQNLPEKLLDEKRNAIH